MRTLDQLIDNNDPGWPFVQRWIGTATNKVEILAADSRNAKRALLNTQVTTRSPMGAIIYTTGGILVDDGWIRILGSGSERLKRSLPDWNKGKTFLEFGETSPFLLIADDAVGGFYALNGGGLGQDVGRTYYFAPDTLEYEPLDMSYSEFLVFCFNNDLETFYGGTRWTNWREEVANLSGDDVFNFYPHLWSKEGSDINKNSRKIVPVEEQYALNHDFRKQMALE